LIDFLSNFY